MNRLKRILGIVWMLLAPGLIGFLLWQANLRMEAAPVATKANVVLQWVIILIIFVPICVGLFLFGRYAFIGEYRHLPSNSTELGDDNPV